MVRTASVRAQRQGVSERMAARETHPVAYADGSCIGNPGPGGWGVLILEPDGSERELSGGDPSTTNNRMEITGVIEALRAVAPGVEVTVRSDSQYVVKTMTLGWKRRENVDLWRQLRPLLEGGETIARCEGCGRMFVAWSVPVMMPYCTLASCQLKARHRNKI